MGISTDKPLLSVSDFFAGYGPHTIVSDVSFSLPEKTLTALIGANGSGKTTLLKGLCRLIPSGGMCRINTASRSYELLRLSTRQLAGQISYIPQRSDPPPSLPVLDIVLMGFEPVLRLLQSPGRRHREAARQALSLVGLSGMEEVNFQTLSEGQRQLVILARALVQDSRLLLLDEPDSALDFANRHMVLHTLRKIMYDKQKAGLLILHDPGLALEYCDQLLLIRDGRLYKALYPSDDSEETMSEAFTHLYGPVRVFRRDGHCFLYPEHDGAFRHREGKETHEA